MSPLFEGFLKENGKNGGVLILSGIITERCDEVIEAVKAKGFTMLEIREKDGWAAVSFTL